MTASLLNAADHCIQAGPRIIRYGPILGLFFVVDGNIWTCSKGLWPPSAFKEHEEISLLSTVDISDFTLIMTVIQMVKSVGMAYLLFINVLLSEKNTTF